MLNLLLQWDKLYPYNSLRKLVIIYSCYQPETYGILQDKYGDKCELYTDLTPEILSEDVIGGLDKEHPACIILDDVIAKVASSPLLSHLFGVIAHHKKYMV